MGATRRRLAPIGAVLLCGAVLLGGCSDDGPPTQPRTQTDTSTSPSEAPSPSPSVSLPLSPMEERPEIQAIRAYLAGFAKAVNEQDFTIPEVTDNATPELVDRAPSLAEDEKGLQYPGPVPFTPLDLSVDTTTRKDVLGCGYSAGYAVDPATGKLPSPPDIKTWEIVVEQSGGRWKVSGIYNEPTVDFSCSGVTIQEVPW